MGTFSETQHTHPVIFILESPPPPPPPGQYTQWVLWGIIEIRGVVVGEIRGRRGGDWVIFSASIRKMNRNILGALTIGGPHLRNRVLKNWHRPKCLSVRN